MRWHKKLEPIATSGTGGPYLLGVATVYLLLFTLPMSTPNSLHLGTKLKCHYYSSYTMSIYTYNATNMDQQLCVLGERQPLNHYKCTNL